MTRVLAITLAACLTASIAAAQEPTSASHAASCGPIAVGCRSTCHMAG